MDESATCGTCGDKLGANGECPRELFWNAECSGCEQPRKECECN